jgi:hypothetical protein
MPIKLVEDTPIPGYLEKIQYVDFSDGVDGKDLQDLLTGLNYIAFCSEPLNLDTGLNEVNCVHKGVYHEQKKTSQVQCRV